MKYFLAIIICFTILPTAVFAASSSIQVGQPAGDFEEPPGGGGGSGDSIAPQIFDVSVTARFDSVTVLWKTNEHTTSRLSWGLNDDYSMGFVVSNQLLLNHQADLLNLLEQNRYYFSIVAIDSSGNRSSYFGNFLTLASPDLTPPQNVTNLNAEPLQNKVRLTWDNPPDLDFELIRIVRSEKFIPIDPFNGQVVYEGTADQFDDVTVEPGAAYYYTVFSRDASGNYSSGSFTIVMLRWFSEQETTGDDKELPYVDVIFPRDEEEFEIIEIKNILFYQNGKRIELKNNNINIVRELPLLVVVPKGELSKDTLTVAATIKSLTFEVAETSYLFALDRSTGNYILQLPPLPKEGKYNFEAFSFNMLKQVQSSGSVNIRATNSPPTVSERIEDGKKVFSFVMPYLIPLFFLLLLLILLYIILKNKSKKDRKK